MAHRCKRKAADEKGRIIFAQHGERRRHTCGDGPSHLAGLKGSQEAIGCERPRREQNRVCIESLRVKLIGRQQHQEQKHDKTLVA
jgi:hypothetical protein